MHREPMRASTVAALTALAMLVSPQVSSAAAAATPAPIPGDVVSIDDLGFHDLPLTWLPEAVVVPGDSADVSVVVRNDRAQPTTVEVMLDAVRPEGSPLFEDLEIVWGGTRVRAGDLVRRTHPVLAPQTLQPGQTQTVTLGYRYPETADSPTREASSLSFTLSFRASAAGDSVDAGAGAGTDDGLAATGGTLPNLAGIVAALVAGFLLVLRRRRRDTQEDDIRSV